MKKLHLLLGTLCLFFHALLAAKELVVATTFSPDTIDYIVRHWQKDFPEQKIRIINRTSGSLERLLDQPNMEAIDLVLSSSPFLFQHLKDNHRLHDLPQSLYAHNILIPDILKPNVTAVAFSGYGILFNKERLRQQQLSPPTDWDSLMNKAYYNGIVMSSPSRSSTAHIMLEMLLQQRGWQQGWQDFLTLASNITFMASRSFNVTERLKMGLGMAGLSIDTYAAHGKAQQDLDFVYFPYSVISPTFIAITKNSNNKTQGETFIQFLLSDKGQAMIANPGAAKLPVQPLALDHPLYALQQKLLANPTLDYGLLLQRRHLVERLFDVAITFRLSTLKESWERLHLIEKQGKIREDIRRILSRIPISNAEATDPQFLSRFKHDRAFALQQEKYWAEFFQKQTEQAISLLEEKP
ncbi:extracellular solute-binding protein [Pasteurellaceae bacterium LIM206]|nr:extracellular solute-binding protein [Pasteurellaceae bacterium LIM206]